MTAMRLALLPLPRAGEGRGEGASFRSPPLPPLARPALTQALSHQWEMEFLR
jgi:hypothetical protein